MLLTSLVAVACLGRPAPSRALWVWHGRPILADAANRRALFQFLRAPKGDPKARISTIFLSELRVDRPASRSGIAGLVRELHRRSVRVDYLCGEAYYALPERRHESLLRIAQVLDYNRHVPRESRFDGFQYDVEPYMLSGWPSEKIYRGYLDLLSNTKSRILAAGQPLKLGAAIPRWFDGANLHGLYRKVLDRVDYVAVMDYVDTSEAFVRDAAKTVAYASRIGKRAWLGAEATELPEEPVATFFRLGDAAMERAFRAAYRAFGRRPGFAGVAVEYYESYRALRP